MIVSSIIQSIDKKFIFGVRSWDNTIAPIGGGIDVSEQGFNEQTIPRNQLKELNEEIGIGEKDIVSHDLIGLDRHGWVGFIFYTKLNKTADQVEQIFRKNTHPDKDEHTDLAIFNIDKMMNIELEEKFKIRVNMFIKSKFYLS